MRKYTQQTDRIRDKTIMTRAIKEVKQCNSTPQLVHSTPHLGLNKLFFFFLLIVIMKSYKYALYLKVIY